MSFVSSIMTYQFGKKELTVQMPPHVIAVTVCKDRKKWRSGGEQKRKWWKTCSFIHLEVSHNKDTHDINNKLKKMEKNLEEKPEEHKRALKVLRELEMNNSAITEHNACVHIKINKMLDTTNHKKLN